MASTELQVKDPRKNYNNKKILARADHPFGFTIRIDTDGSNGANRY